MTKNNYLYNQLNFYTGLLSISIKTSFILIFLVCFSFTGKIFAQNKKIEEIRNYYNNLNKDLQSLKESNVPCTYEIKLQRTIPGTGPQSLLITYYFFEKDLIYEQGNKIELVKISVSYNIAARKFYREFVFKDEKLIFYFFKPDINNATNEIRNYYDDNKLILYAVAPEQSIAEYNQTRTLKSSNFTADEMKESRGILESAAEYLKNFKNLVKIQETIY
jgi:hypothetical protein